MTYKELISILQNNYPNIDFKAGDHFAWSSSANKITYLTQEGRNTEIKLANKLLHELAHAKLEHSDYKSDAQLLKIESSAWSLAKDFCKEYGVKFNQEEQQEALVSYTHWASSRSQCPKCQKNGLQTAPTAFMCPNCTHKWSVGKSRFTRTYRH